MKISATITALLVGHANAWSSPMTMKVGKLPKDVVCLDELYYVTWLIFIYKHLCVYVCVCIVMNLTE